jgi:long-chain acyl-CoA synthetase
VPATALNLAALLDHQARLTPEHPAVVCRPHVLSYAALETMASQVAAGLRALGFGPGDRIGLSCPNTPHFPVAYYGILKLGAVVVPLNVLLKPQEIAYHLNDCDAVAHLVFEGTPTLPMAAMAREACDGVPSCRQLVVMTIEAEAPCPVDRALTLGQLMHGQRGVFVTHPTAADDTAVILYTSGTTGQPKGAELTHLNMTFNALASKDMLMAVMDTPDLRQRPVSLVTLPLFHSTGQTCQLNAGMAGGWTLVLLPRFEAAAVLQAFEQERVTCWIGVPTMYWALLKQAREQGLDVARVAASLSCCVSGGAPLPVAILEQFEKTFGVRVLEGYGLSETSPVVCFNQAQRPSKPGTVGLPILGCDVAIVDEAGQRLGVGERGEVVVRGHNVMKGYYGRPDETADAMRGGWFHTGDVGTIDEDGYVTIVDRLKDMLIRGGMNVYPREIEELLMTHPAVSLAAVVGVPDERLGEEVKAYVVVKAGQAVTAETLIEWSRARLAAYKYPRSIEFRESLPVGPTGKVFKRGL